MDRARGAAVLDLDAPETFDPAVDQLVAALGDATELLGFGEALHGGEELLVLRNRLFRRLVEAHGYSAIAIESSFALAREVDDYVAGHGPDGYERVEERGFSNGFGRLAANRELVEWMRRYNADPARPITLRFFGFDLPTSAEGPTSPRQILHFALDYLAAPAPADADQYRRRIEPLLGPEADWENPPGLARSGPCAGIGRQGERAADRDRRSAQRTPRASAGVNCRERGGSLRGGDPPRRAGARVPQFLCRPGREKSFAGSLAVRDVLMADNLTYIAGRERGRGKVLAFAHNSHLQRGLARIVVGADTYRWWPAGAQLDAILGPRYAVIGTAVGVSEENGIGQPEADTLEASLLAARGQPRFIPTHRGQGLPASVVAALPTRTLSARNPSYMAGLSSRELHRFRLARLPPLGDVRARRMATAGLIERPIAEAAAILDNFLDGRGDKKRKE